MTDVACELDVVLEAPATLVLQVAVAPGTLAGSETLIVTGVAGPLATHRLLDASGNALDVVAAPTGPISVRYQASGGAAPVPARPADELSQWEAIRPSRYCPSDRLLGHARALVQPDWTPTECVQALTEHVYKTLTYESGASDEHTDAIGTLDAGRGVCRDYAHVVVALARALDIPARVAAVYAPGLDPMDFHLVAETALDGHWYVWDATRLTSRHHLVRIGTGRDAADVSFCTNIGGALTVERLQILAVAADAIRPDDHRSLIPLP